MKAIQHDVQSLRHAAIQRYLGARDRINRHHKRQAVGAILLVLATAVVLCAIVLVRAHTR